MRTALEDAHREVDNAVSALTLLAPRLTGDDISLALAGSLATALERLEWHLHWGRMELTDQTPKEAR